VTDDAAALATALTQAITDALDAMQIEGNRTNEAFGREIAHRVLAALPAHPPAPPEGSIVVPQGGGVCHYCLQPDVESIRAAVKAEYEAKDGMRVRSMVISAERAEALEAAGIITARVAAPTAPPPLDVERLAEAHHAGCCSDSWFRQVRFQSLPKDGTGCRGYHVETAARTLTALRGLATPEPTEPECTCAAEYLVCPVHPNAPWGPGSATPEPTEDPTRGSS
jgi:hypothetical protein